jgi:hypothetical protein
MTFAVIQLGETNEKVVGTIWADAESEAQVIASNLLNLPDKERVVIRRDEDREIPMKPFN